ncbi:hypothetical protein [Pacificibacter sp. AS14]|uniref:hypothetical protein n=1 Tax=Pacificibacter sp. AS14 TaxID=3135785 RepID=UPI003177CFCB
MEQNPERSTLKPLQTITAKADSSICAPLLATMRNSQKPWQGINEPTHTITVGGAGLTLISPSITRFNGGATGQDLRDPMATITANSFIKRPGGAAPLGIIAPALATYYGHTDGRSIRNADLAEPLRTVTAENRHALIAPSLMSMKGTARRSCAIDAPTPNGFGRRRPQRTYLSRPFSPMRSTVAQTATYAPHITRFVQTAKIRTL